MILGIDQGTTGTTAVVFDQTMTPRAQGYSRVRREYPRPDWVEINPEVLLTSVTSAVRAALEDGPVSPDQISAVGLANQGETALCWDENGDPVANAIVWQDNRTANRCQSIRDDADLRSYIRETTGLPVDSYFSATKLEWILEHEVDTAPTGLHVGTTDTWLLWQIAEGEPYVTDHTTAGRTMLFDIRKLDWDDRLRETFGLAEVPLPTPVACDEIIGTTDPDRFAGIEAPIAGCIVDQEASLYGQGCHLPGDTKCTYGTGSFIVTNVGTEPIVESNGLLPVIAWSIGGETQYAVEGGIFTVGALIDWLVDDLHLFSAPEETDRQASSVTCTNGLYIVPALTGLAAPYWDRSCRGSVFGLDASTTPAHIARAALEAIAYRVRDVVDAIDEAMPSSIDALRVDGGLTANEFLLQYQADVLDASLEVSAVTESTALGAAAIAGGALGLDVDTDRLEAVSQRVNPTAEVGQAHRHYARWQQVVELTRQWQPAEATD